MGEKKFIKKVEETYSGERLDKAITFIFPSFSRREFRRLISKGSVYLNGRRCLKLSKILKKGDLVEILLDNKKEIVVEEEQLEVLFDDVGLIAVNKPPFLSSVPSKSEIYSVQAIVAKQKGLEIKKVHPVNRLDRPVSGVLLFAYEKETTRNIELLKRENLIEKVYFAWVEGILTQKEGKIDFAISAKKGTAYIDSEGKESITIYKTIKNIKGFSFIEIRPLTGRMHQIRLHLKEAGFPIVGDKKYGHSSYKWNRPLLHCAKLSFFLKKNIVIEARIWDDFTLFEEEITP